jgi:hypothetical protein
MATEALTYVARSASFDLGTVMQVSVEGQSWQALLENNDAEEIWRRISALVSTVFSSPEDVDQITQDIFLHMLSTGRFSLYVDRCFSDEEVRLDMLSVMNG